MFCGVFMSILLLQPQPLYFGSHEWAHIEMPTYSPAGFSENEDWVLYELGRN